MLTACSDEEEVGCLLKYQPASPKAPVMIVRRTYRSKASAFLRLSVCLFFGLPECVLGEDRDTHDELGIPTGALLEDLSTFARVDARGRDILVAARVDVTSAEAQGRGPRVDVVPVVVVVRNTEVAAVLASVAAGMTDERALPLKEL